MSAKMMFGLTEPILLKESKQGAARLLGAMFETCLERLEALALVHDEVAGSLARIKEGSTVVVLDAAIIEKARPVGGAIYATEKPEEVIHG
jgi:transformation/transcription domain-associated protein